MTGDVFPLPMTDDSAIDGLYYRWKTLRDAGRPSAPAVLCRDRPNLVVALEARIAAEQPLAELIGPDLTGAELTGPELTGGYEPADHGISTPG